MTEEAHDEEPTGSIRVPLCKDYSSIPCFCKRLLDWDFAIFPNSQTLNKAFSKCGLVGKVPHCTPLVSFSSKTFGESGPVKQHPNWLCYCPEESFLIKAEQHKNRSQHIPVLTQCLEILLFPRGVVELLKPMTRTGHLLLDEPNLWMLCWHIWNGRCCSIQSGVYEYHGLLGWFCPAIHICYLIKVLMGKQVLKEVTCLQPTTLHVSIADKASPLIPIHKTGSR